MDFYMESQEDSCVGCARALVLPGLRVVLGPVRTPGLLHRTLRRPSSKKRARLEESDMRL